MNKKGFTLIELLAIIVILAIIAVITVPLILGIIDNAKEKAVTDSAYGYKDAVNKLYASKLLDNRDYKMEDRVYTISELNTEGLSVSGTEPDSNSWIQIENNNVKSGCLQFDEYKVDITNGNIGSAQKSECIMPFNPTSLIVTSGDGLYESTTDPGRLIYRGANPNNYINIKEDGINDTLYRIVSIEADGTIKVVRDESIGNIAWDAKNVRKSDGTNNTYCRVSSSGCNVWGNQTNTLYNGSPLGDNFHYIYYASADATTLTNGESGTVGSDSTLNQYLNSKTNNAENSWQPAIVLDNYIDNHSWNVGGVYESSTDKGILKEKEEERQLKWTGKIALLNITEFVEASTNSSCSSAKAGQNNQNPCKESNWAYKGISEWSFSPYPYYHDMVWYMYSSGSFFYNSALSAIGVRPAFYLKSEISLTGEGTSGNPYTISNM